MAELSVSFEVMISNSLNSLEVKGPDLIEPDIGETKEQTGESEPRRWIHI